MSLFIRLEYANIVKAEDNAKKNQLFFLFVEDPYHYYEILSSFVLMALII